MTVPEQAVEAALAEWRSPHPNENTAMKCALTAALPLMGVQQTDVAHDKAFANGVKACLQRLYAAGVRTGEHHRAWEDCEAMWRTRYDAAQSGSGVMRREDVARPSHAKLLENARSAASRLLGYCEQNEAEFTGWGDQIVPPEAEALTAQAQRIFDAFDALPHTGQPVEEHTALIARLRRANLHSPFEQTRSLMHEAADALSASAASPASPQKREGKWRPIETAEKTGECRLLACPQGVRTLGFWGKGVSEPEGSESWRDSCRWRSIKPTHWMPLPTVPQSLVAEKGTP